MHFLWEYLNENIVLIQFMKPVPLRSKKKKPHLIRFRGTTGICIVSVVNHQGERVHVFINHSTPEFKDYITYLLLYIWSSQGNSRQNSFPLLYGQSGQGRRMIQGRSWKSCRAGLSLSLSNIVGWIQTAPEAELSRALSCDLSKITRQINTRVEKVKRCYVVRCYWTWCVTLHDTDTFYSIFFCIHLLNVGLSLTLKPEASAEPLQSVNGCSWALVLDGV